MREVLPRRCVLGGGLGEMTMRETWKGASVWGTTPKVRIRGLAIILSRWPLHPKLTRRLSAPSAYRPPGGSPAG